MHCVWLTRPVSVEKVPAKHGLAEIEPSGQKCAGGQRVGVTVASLGHRYPAGHWPEQRDEPCESVDSPLRPGEQAYG